MLDDMDGGVRILVIALVILLLLVLAVPLIIILAAVIATFVLGLGEQQAALLVLVSGPRFARWLRATAAGGLRDREDATAPTE